MLPNESTGNVVDITDDGVVNYEIEMEINDASAGSILLAPPNAQTDSSSGTTTLEDVPSGTATLEDVSSTIVSQIETTLSDPKGNNS